VVVEGVEDGEGVAAGTEGQVEVVRGGRVEGGEEGEEGGG